MSQFVTSGLQTVHIGAWDMSLSLEIVFFVWRSSLDTRTHALLPVCPPFRQWPRLSKKFIELSHLNENVILIWGLINNENLLGNPRVNLIRISWSGQGVIHHTWASRELNSWKREAGMKRRFLGNVLCLKVTGWWKVKVYHTLNTEYGSMAQAVPGAGAFLQSQLMNMNSWSKSLAGAA